MPKHYENLKTQNPLIPVYFLERMFEDRRLKRELGDEREFREWYPSILRLYKRRRYMLGSDVDKAQLRKKWIMPILNYLGFSPEAVTRIEGEKREYVISGIEYHEMRPLVLFKFLDFAKNPEISDWRGRLSPQKEIQLALYYSDAKYGIITNGKSFRLIGSDPITQGYIEVDLISSLETEDEDSLFLFWNLFRKNSFVPREDGRCLLDRLIEEGRKNSIEMGEGLRETIVKTMEKLMRGLIRENEWLAKENLYRVYEECLVFLYRILFILYAESTELLPVSNPLYRSYSMEFLKELVTDPRREFGKGEYFLWSTLKSLFKLINEGLETSGLEVPAYNGGLFSESKTPLLNKCKLSDHSLCEVLRDLFLTPEGRGGRTFISYRELGIDQLGSIYENLLELEPKIADEDLAVVKIKNAYQMVPKRSVKNERIMEEIRKGELYLSYWGGRRKSSGTYYTPKEITRFLVRSALEPILEGKSSDEILEVKVLDPAMGSGAFLVSALEVISEKYKEALIREGRISEEELDEEKEAEIRRRVLERCIYGVDLNPMAVELAKVSLWLSTMARDKPLTFLDHKLKCGNSLIGASLKDIARYPRKRRRRVPREEEQTIFIEGFSWESISRKLERLSRLRERLSLEDETLEAVRAKEELYRDFLDGRIDEGLIYRRLKTACDLWTYLFFGGELTDGEYFRALHLILEGRDLNEEFPGLLEKLEEVSERYKFFHWELEFPEVFAGGGFDAVFGNPPWDIVKPNSDEFFSNYDPYFRSYKKQKKNRLMNKLIEENEDIRKSWEEYVDRIERESFFFRNSGLYPHQYKGDINLYKLFLERFFWLMKEGGRMSIIVPSGLYTDEGCKELRRMFLENSRIEFLIGIENRQGIFPIHKSFKFTLLSTKKRRQERDYKFKVGFFIGSRPDNVKNEILDAETILEGSFAPKAEELENLLPLVLEKGLEISRDLIEKFSPDTLSIMEFKRQKDIDLAEKIYDDWPLLGERDERWAWNVKFTTEFHMTNDSHLFVTKEQLEKMGAKPLDDKGLRWVVEKDGKKEIYLPLYEGKMIWQFDAFYEKPQYWISLEVVLKRLADKNALHFQGLPIEQ